MKVAGFLLIVLIFIISIPHPEVASATDVVQIAGYVYDVEGNPVKSVLVFANSLAPPWVDYGYANTDARGHYTLSFQRPKRLDVPVSSTGGRPVYEGYGIWVDSVREGLMPAFLVVNTENTNVIEQDFVLEPAGRIRIKAYDSTGSLIERFPDRPTPFTTDLYWRVSRSQFIRDAGMFVLGLGTPYVINFPWDAQGFGRVILRADNGGKGFKLTKQGETVTVNLNYELARTEYRLLKESYDKYLADNYTFPKGTLLRIQSAGRLIETALSATDEVQKAHLSDLCLNQTLWVGEDLEIERALQDIEKYRKGDVILRVVDENDKPIEGADVSLTQVTHDFLFGTELNKFFKETAMNYALQPLSWVYTEPSLGHFCWETLPTRTYLESFRETGFRLGGEHLINLEPTPETWTTGLLGLSFEELKDKVYEHVYTLVSEYADYIDYWTVVTNPHYQSNYMGFTREQVIELYKTAIRVVRTIDPTAKVLVFVDHICGWAVGPLPYDDKYSVDPYTYLSRLDEYGIDHDGIALGLVYGSVDEFPKGFWMDISQIQLAKTDIVTFPFRDLGSISRLLDWYGTLNEPIHITYFHAPANFTSNLGYWHRRSWDEKLQSEWVEKFYTIAFSKLMMTDITYMTALDADYVTTGRGIVSAKYIPRESFYTLEKLITEDWTTRLHMKTDANGQLEFRGFAGDYNITVSTKDFTGNFTIHVDEGASNTYTIDLGRAIAGGKAERAIGQAEEAVGRAKAEGRTIYLDKAENLLEDARKALIEENYTQAILLAEEASRAADLAVTWLVIPTVIAFAGVVVSTMILYRRVRAKKRKPPAV